MTEQLIGQATNLKEEVCKGFPMMLKSDYVRCTKKVNG